MTYYIQMHGSRPLNDKEFATIADALEFARAPAWAGAGPTEITIVGEAAYTYRGQRYEIVEGRNPKLLRAEAAKAQSGPAQRAAFNGRGSFRGATWLSREMDRADSDF